MVAAAIEPLVVGGGVEAARRESTTTRLRISHVCSGCRRITANSAVGQLSGLSRIRFDTPSLPMSCSSARAPQLAQLAGPRGRARAPCLGNVGDAVRVTVRPRRLGVDHPRERLGDPVEIRIVGQQHAILAAPSSLQALQRPATAEIAPEARIPGDRLQRIDELRVEPGAAAAAAMS